MGDPARRGFGGRLVIRRAVDFVVGTVSVLVFLAVVVGLLVWLL